MAPGAARPVTMATAPPIPGPLRLDRDFDLPMARLHVHDWPGGRGPLVCLPGQTASGRSFDSLAASLSPVWRVLAVDPRGRGESARPRHGSGYQLQVADTLALLDTLGIEQAVLVGHSFGAVIGLLLAAWYPRRVAGLVLLDGGAEIPDHVHRGVRLLVERLDTVYPSREAYLGLLKLAPAFQPWTPELEAFFTSSVVDVPGGVRARTDRGAVEQEIRAYLDGPPAYDRLYAAIRCPTLVVRATGGFMRPDDPVLPEKTYRAMLARMPTARGIEIEGANHYTVLLGRPTRTIEAVRAFVSGLSNQAA